MDTTQIPDGIRGRNMKNSTQAQTRQRRLLRKHAHTPRRIDARQHDIAHRAIPRHSPPPDLPLRRMPLAGLDWPSPAVTHSSEPV